MKNLWLRIGCFFTGYNYDIVNSSSEASKTTVKRFMSAILIVSILWAFIGYSFASRYLKLGLWGSIAVSVILVIIVIQIERQITLSSTNRGIAMIFRFFIGGVMAVIGSVIIDQVIFKEDLEKWQISNIQAEVDDVVPAKTRQLDFQIAQVDSAIMSKETERIALINDLAINPFVKSSTSHTRNIPMQIIDDSTGLQKDTIVKRVDYTLTEVPNPKAEFLPGIEQNISILTSRKVDMENRKLNIRQEVELELKSKTGFLDELDLLISILTGSKPAMLIWLLFFCFFLFLELFVLVNKIGESETDYDLVINHQQITHRNKLNRLTDRSNKNQLTSIN